MVRILHYIGSLHIGGSQSFVMELYRKMDRTKIQFDFVTFPESREGNYEEVEKLGGRIFVCPRYSGLNHRAFCKWWDGFLTENTHYHIVHGHVRSCASIYMPIVKKHGRIAIAHSHSTSNGQGFSAIVKKILQLPIRNIADYLFSCSDIAGKWLYGEKATRRDNYRVVPNCVDCRRFSFSEQERKAIRTELKIADGTCVIGHIGRFHEAKNHSFLVQVFAEVLKMQENAVLLLVGDGDRLAQTQQLCKDLGICQKVIFMGAQIDPVRYYQAMDLFLFPSLWEGLPMSVVEAQANGLPCLISDTITKNVHLTDLVEYESLDKSARHWAEKALQNANAYRTSASAEQMEKMKCFDSNYVAKDVQEFYLSI